MDNWFYNLEGKRAGPVSKGILQSMFEAGSISEDTLIWNGASGHEWTKYADYFKHEDKSEPPPLPTSAVSDRWAWIAALTPVALTALDLWLIAATGSGLGFSSFALISSIIYLTCLALDSRLLAAAGYGKRMRGAGAWILLTPAAYLFVRAKRLNKSLAPGFVWIATFVLPILFVIAIGQV